MVKPARRIQPERSRTQSDGDKDHQKVDEPMLKLVVAHRGSDDGTTETCCDADRDAANHATNHDVPQHALLAVPTAVQRRMRSTVSGRREIKNKEGGAYRGAK